MAKGIEQSKAEEFAASALRMLVRARFEDLDTARSLRKAAKRYLQGCEAVLCG